MLWIIPTDFHSLPATSRKRDILMRAVRRCFLQYVKIMAGMSGKSVRVCTICFRLPILRKRLQSSLLWQRSSIKSTVLVGGKGYGRACWAVWMPLKRSMTRVCVIISKVSGKLRGVGALSKIPKEIMVGRALNTEYRSVARSRMNRLETKPSRRLLPNVTLHLHHRWMRQFKKLRPVMGCCSVAEVVC
ncbi:hypothetical protein D3C81_565960 [compost metagenome]